MKIAEAAAVEAGAEASAAATVTGSAQTQAAAILTSPGDSSAIDVVKTNLMEAEAAMEVAAEEWEDEEEVVSK